jgi:hypothetical protein
MVAENNSGVRPINYWRNKISAEFCTARGTQLKVFIFAPFQRLSNGFQTPAKTLPTPLPTLTGMGGLQRTRP